MLVEKLFDVDAVVKVGEAFAIIETSVKIANPLAHRLKRRKSSYPQPQVVAEKIEEEIAQVKESVQKRRIMINAFILR